MSDRTLWLHTEGGTVHVACGAVVQVCALGDRYVAAHVASSVTVGPCCHGEDMACAFDQDEPTEVVALAWSLARAEGRDIDPPHLCPVHQVLTFGGCCDGTRTA